MAARLDRGVPGAGHNTGVESGYSIGAGYSTGAGHSNTFTLSRADHVARMDRRLGAKDFGAAMRAAKRAGDDRVAIVKACIAAEAKSAKSGALLDAVSAEARMDLGIRCAASTG